MSPKEISTLNFSMVNHTPLSRDLRAAPDGVLVSLYKYNTWTLIFALLSFLLHVASLMIILVGEKVFILLFSLVMIGEKVTSTMKLFVLGAILKRVK